MAAKRILLKAGRSRSLLRRHPWIFSGAIERADAGIEAGDTVEVRGSDDRFLAHAAYSPRSQIRARAWSFEEDDAVDAAFMHTAIERAIAFRRHVLDPGIEACRLVHAECDRLPGLVVDLYADTAVMQCSSAGAERWREAFADALMASGICRRVYERSDADARTMEGLALRSGPLRGDEPPADIAIREGGASFLIDVRQGQKTGFYLDQRDNRALVRASARGRAVLDIFAYTGGFAIAAMLGGAASVTAIDSSEAAIRRARENLAASGLAAEAIEWHEADAFEALRRMHEAGRRFDLAVLDPPKLAPLARPVERAARAYKDLNLWALRLLRPGGMLFTFSCSGAIDAALFQSIVAGAAADARVAGRIVARLGASRDHPVALEFPEGEYLKGLEVIVG
jgi:23S rRNA (cytosine1962-C5)-methyltransferase